MELRLVDEEREKLTKELKRTPELIETALSELREQCEHPSKSRFDHQKFHPQQLLGLTLSLNMVLRREQSTASAAGAGAELGAGPGGRGWQRAGGTQPAADPGPTCRVPSQPGGRVPSVASPAGAWRAQ